MEEDDDPFAPWDQEERPPLRTSRRPGKSDALLIPLARAQDAVARLEAAVAASPADVAAGLRARLGLIEAAGYLAHRGPAVHPHDLALRDAGLTGSYAVAALTGRLKREAPWTTAAGAADGVADDHLVAHPPRARLCPPLAPARGARDRAAARLRRKPGDAAGAARRAPPRRRSDARLARRTAGA
jgi:hypothetical protein